MILQGNAVGKHILRLQRIAVIGLVKCFHAYLYALRDHTCHVVKIKKLRQTVNPGISFTLFLLQALIFAPRNN